MHLAHLRRRNLSPGTIEQRRLALARFERFIGRSIIDAETEEVQAFLDRPVRDGSARKPETVAAELAHLRGLFRWLVLEEHRKDDPTMRVPRPKLPRRLPRPIPENDLARVVEQAPDRVRPMLMLAAYAGLRAVEIAGLRGEDLWWSSDPPLIFIRRQKGGDEAAVPMAPVLAPVLRELPKRGWCFPLMDGRLGVVTPHRVSQICNDHLHACGVWNHTLHSLRHRFGTQVYRLSGRDLRQTQELMRHRSPVSTAIYTQVDQGEAVAIVSALPA